MTKWRKRGGLLIVVGVSLTILFLQWPMNVQQYPQNNTTRVVNFHEMRKQDELTFIESNFESSDEKPETALSRTEPRIASQGVQSQSKGIKNEKMRLSAKKVLLSSEETQSSTRVKKESESVFISVNERNFVIKEEITKQQSAVIKKENQLKVGQVPIDGLTVNGEIWRPRNKWERVYYDEASAQKYYRQIAADESLFSFQIGYGSYPSNKGVIWIVYVK